MTTKSFSAIAIVAGSLLLSLAAPAFAQRDAGAKMRGDFGGGFYSRGRSGGTQSPYQMRRSFSYQPSETAAPPQQDRRSFSFQPTVHVGDTVVVTDDAVNLMAGKKKLGLVERGHEFTVTHVKGQWLGAKIEMDGEMVPGWVKRQHVSVVTPVEDTLPRSQG